MTPLFARELKNSNQEKQNSESPGEMELSPGTLICCKTFATNRSDASVLYRCLHQSVQTHFLSLYKRACLHFHSDTTWRFLFFSLANMSRQGNRVERERVSLLMKGRADLIFLLWGKKQRIKSPNMRHCVSVIRELFILCSSQDSWEFFSNSRRTCLTSSTTTKSLRVILHISFSIFHESWRTSLTSLCLSQISLMDVSKDLRCCSCWARFVLAIFQPICC